MFKKVLQMLGVSFFSSIMTVGMMSSMYIPKTEYQALVAKVEAKQIIDVVMAEELVEPTTEDILIETSLVETPVIEKVESYSVSCEVTQEDVELIALVVMAEAEGESELGQRLVVDTILNRVDGKYWPNTINEVIYQKNQFTSMWNGRTNRCYVKPELVELVRDELKNRTNNDVVFFRTTRYSDYGVPMFQEGAHYFSSYN